MKKELDEARNKQQKSDLLASQLRKQVEMHMKEGEEKNAVSELNERLRREAEKAKKELQESTEREKVLTQTVNQLNVTMSQMLSS